MTNPPYCHTKEHLWHTYVPWFWNALYDHSCHLCGHAAALEFGSGDVAIYLCDCCAEDWNEWTEKHPSWAVEPTDLGGIELLQNEEELHRVWGRAFQAFVKEATAY